MGKIFNAFQWFTLFCMSACASGAPSDGTLADESDVAGTATTSDIKQGSINPANALQIEKLRKQHGPRAGRGHWNAPPWLEHACKAGCAAGTTCRLGRCVPVPCPTGQLRCDGQCVDTRNDQMNCGGCAYPSTVTGYAKPTPCRTDPLTGVCGCDPNLIDLATVCGDSCVDVNADPNHCGGCGRSCRSNERCESGDCVPACAAAMKLEKLDHGTFVSYNCYASLHPGSHCAGSGTGEEAACVSGQCQCASGFSLCSDPQEPSFKYCADLANDREHCGKCDENCGVGAECIAGACKPIDCPKGQMLCRDTCVDLTSDARACGGCTELFPVPRDSGGEARVWSDDTGTVEATCSNGHCYCDVWTGPPDRCVVGAQAYCANFQKDRDNCGGCGRTCAADEHCVAGSCVPECGPGFTLALVDVTFESSGLRGSCVNGNVVGKICAEEATCEAGSCTCPGGQVACRNPSDAPDLALETHCTDLNTSNLHCGTCGQACQRLGERCVAGSCAQTP